MFPCSVVVLKLSKKVQFLQFCAVLSKKPETVKTTCIYASESSHYILSENDMVYRGSDPPFMKYRQLKYQD